VSAARQRQADRVVQTISEWLAASPDERSISLRQVLGGRWEAVLTEARRAGGATALDALAQVATTAAVENETR